MKIIRTALGLEAQEDASCFASTFTIRNPHSLDPNGNLGSGG
jgi:hypothetical protein